ncbi:hypothetical protein M9194_02330 [Vibrio sp. S4M6]|uniref:hypothetical protein n=1 Tax=Vibrio sinus TaxID=2946865 RepID=UPI00202A21FA|nr:hypothetical protein [Vibrio sinus]MCL9780268.1 hypothetical protein [Vibrio sinus]
MTQPVPGNMNRAEYVPTLKVGGYRSYPVITPSSTEKSFIDKMSEIVFVLCNFTWFSLPF